MPLSFLTMEDELMLIYWGRHSKTAKLDKLEVKSIEAFYEHFIENPPEGKKGGPYITTASEVEITPKSETEKTDFRNTDHFRRNNATHLSSWCVAIDGDRREDNEEFSIAPQLVTASLRKLNINHIIYTTSSHKPDKPKWRLLVPCRINPQEDIAIIHQATVKYLYGLLKSNGCKALKEQPESFVLSQMWFLPVATEDYYRCIYMKGESLKSQTVSTECVAENSLTQIVTDRQTYDEIIDIITSGKSPLHSTIGKYIWGAIRDCRNPTEIKATLHGLTKNYNLKDKRLKDRKDDIDRRVDAARVKYLSESFWEPEEQNNNDRVFTKYPNQGGRFERLVQINMKRMIYPNRPIAVTAARFQISVLGGRVYTGTTGKGLVQTILLTGRSTIGKSFVKKNSVWVFDNLLMNRYSIEFMGASYYTSVKNFVEDANGRYSLGSIRTESGQSDKSKAGDMSRVLMYELEAATESGETGFISSGAQNDKIPTIFSPAITTVRESVAEIQKEADILLQTSIAGIEGRRSYVVADPLKDNVPNTPLEEIPQEDKKWLIELLTLTIDDRRKKWDEPLNKDLWIRWTYEDPEYLSSKQREWIEKENEANAVRDMYTTTIYGRMGEKVPAYAALLAVCENPKAPCITNEQIDIAEQSILAEMLTHKQQHTNGELSGPWGQLEHRILRVFSKDLTRHFKFYVGKERQTAMKELEMGCIGWSPIMRKLQHFEPFRVLKERPDFHRLFRENAESWNIVQLSKDETKRLFGHQRKTFRRV